MAEYNIYLALVLAVLALLSGVALLNRLRRMLGTPSGEILARAAIKAGYRTEGNEIAMERNGCRFTYSQGRWRRSPYFHRISVKCPVEAQRLIVTNHSLKQKNAGVFDVYSENPVLQNRLISLLGSNNDEDVEYFRANEGKLGLDIPAGEIRLGETLSMRLMPLLEKDASAPFVADDHRILAQISTPEGMEAYCENLATMIRHSFGLLEKIAKIAEEK